MQKIRRTKKSPKTKPKWGWGQKPLVMATKQDVLGRRPSCCTQRPLRMRSVRADRKQTYSIMSSDYSACQYPHCSFSLASNTQDIEWGGLMSFVSFDYLRLAISPSTIWNTAGIAMGKELGPVCVCVCVVMWPFGRRCHGKPYHCLGHSCEAVSL